MQSRRRSVWTVLGLTVVVAGCSGAGSGSDPSTTPERSPRRTTPAPAARATGAALEARLAGTCEPPAFFKEFRWHYTFKGGRATFEVTKVKTGQKRTYAGTYDVRAAKGTEIPAKLVMPLRRKPEPARIHLLDSGHLVVRGLVRGDSMLCTHSRPKARPNKGLRRKLLERLQSTWIADSHSMRIQGDQADIALRRAKYKGRFQVTGAARDLLTMAYGTGAQKHLAFVEFASNTQLEISIQRDKQLLWSAHLYRSLPPKGADAAVLKSAEARLRGTCIGKQRLDTPKLTIQGGRFSVLKYAGTYTIVEADADQATVFYRTTGQSRLGRLVFLDDGNLEVQRGPRGGFSSSETCTRVAPTAKPIRNARTKARRRTLLKRLQGTWRNGPHRVVIAGNRATLQGPRGPRTATFTVKVAGLDVLHLDLKEGAKHHAAKIFFKGSLRAHMTVGNLVSETLRRAP